MDVYEYINELGHDGQFEKIDDVLINSNPNGLSFDMAIDLLKETLRFKEHLKFRAAFYERVSAKLKKDMGEEAALSLLEGLE